MVKRSLCLQLLDSLNLPTSSAKLSGRSARLLPAFAGLASLLLPELTAGSEHALVGDKSWRNPVMSLE